VTPAAAAISADTATIAMLLLLPPSSIIVEDGLGTAWSEGRYQKERYFQKLGLALTQRIFVVSSCRGVTLLVLPHGKF
jgi:hypothetical protein